MSKSPSSTTSPQPSRRLATVLLSGAALTAGIFGSAFAQQKKAPATPAKAVSAADVEKPGDLPDIVVGEASAPVTIVEYASMTCPHCAAFHTTVYPTLKQKYIDAGKVRMIFREFPIGKTSGTATIALRCAPMDKYLQLYEKFLSQQSAWVSQEVRPDAIFKVAQQVGMSRADFDACLANQPLIEALKGIKDRGRQLGVIGTPNFFIEERLVKKVVGIKEMREMLDPLLAGQPATAQR